jgi:lysophospholipase L1-like esterase
VAHRRIAWILAALSALAPAATAQDAVVELRKGDRIAFLGDSFFEREYRFGLIETALTLAHPEKGLTFRSLGWTGDTVWGEARAYFGKPSDGYAELLKNVALADPTVIFVAYGGNESFSGADGLATFLTQYRALLDDLTARTPRVVLLTPLPHERASSPLPADLVEARSRTLAQYARAIRDLAQSRRLQSIDLFSAMQTAMDRAGRPLFQNGMHLTEAGYAAAAAHIAERTLPPDAAADFVRVWRGSASAPAGPVDPATQTWEPLRDLIVAKNDSFFHRWRPANANYVYLSRRGRQGTTAEELPRFDPVIVEQERAIAKLAAELAPAASRERDQ